MQFLPMRGFGLLGKHVCGQVGHQLCHGEIQITGELLIMLYDTRKHLLDWIVSKFSLDDT